MDLSWLQREAVTLHGIFQNAFYLLATVLILIGVVCDYFKIPMGGTPDFGMLIIRALVAALLLVALPEITNAIADVTDAFANTVGDLHNISLVMERTSQKLHELTWSWSSIKQLAIVGISFITFFLVYISVYIANAGVAFVWVLIYVFSPLLIAMFILPATAGATTALFRALFEVSAWKICWSVLATLLWSTAAIDIEKASQSPGFLTVVCYNLILACSVLLTPLVVNALTSKGLASMTASVSGMALAAASFNPALLATKAQKTALGKTAGLATQSVRGGFGLSSGGLGKQASGIPKNSIQAPRGSPSPPPWISKIPPPTEPPGWLQKRLRRESHAHTTRPQPKDGDKK
ncbi:MAG: hypothetical protein JST16_02810 [Bdellovibrionales bacterium]|nr:hypothetical protein [Bdellovibrionales bacterium]